MARYKVILAYDGTHFQGFQRQESRVRTVQSEVEQALRSLGWEGRSILSAGRTDSGVHASGQVIAFDFVWQHSTQALTHAVNAHLPSDVAVVSVSIAPEGFHPRFDAVSRAYRYRIYCAETRNPLLDRYAWRVWPAVDLEKLRSAASLLAGTHDFAAFGAPPQTGGSTLRTVYAVSWKVNACELEFEVSANAFLYHMVRRMVFVQVLAGQNQLELEDISRAVQRAQPLKPGLAPPNGLYLTEVRYLSE